MTSQSLCERWGTPEWEDAEKYQYVLMLSPELRRWEFLRRRAEYRVAWGRLGPKGHAFGLARLIDPMLNALQLTHNPDFIDWALSGGPIGGVVKAPKLDHLLTLPIQEQRDAMALDLGRQAMAFSEAGYVLFSVDPRKAAKKQGQLISHWIAAWQKRALADADPEGTRINVKRHDRPDRLLRVLDAYEQEAIGKPSSKRTKTEVGKAIFGAVKRDVDWHKELTLAYEQALAEAEAPFPVPLRGRR